MKKIVENSKESTKKSMISNKCVQLSYRMQDQYTKSVVFLGTCDEQSKNESKKTIFYLSQHQHE